MENKKITIQPEGSEALAFPVKWIRSNPGEVEKILSRLSIPDQAQCIMQLKGRDQMEILLLSPNSREVIQSLPPEQLYHLIKEVGEMDALPVLACANQEQIQYIFDLEWWQGDRFLPERAVDWLELLDKCDEEKFLEWILSEEFDQKVMVLQSLIKVFKNDEMTDSYDGVENLKHLTLDSVYDIFFKDPEAEQPLEKILKLLVAEDKKVFDALMEAVIWYPVSQTVEKSYQWRLSRVGEKGIPEFEEACEVYSRLDPESLNLPVSSGKEFEDEESQWSIAPHYPVVHVDPAMFLSRCLARMKDQQRINTICWELVYLANKVMVADRADPSILELRNEIMSKVLGYINIGLELGSDREEIKGEKLLHATWMQSLFQVGYGKVTQLKSQAHALIHEEGKILEFLIAPGQLEAMSALVYRFPKIEVIHEAKQDESHFFNGRDLNSLDDIKTLESFLQKMKFYVRLARMGLGLTVENLIEMRDQVKFPEDKNDLDMIHIMTTVMARFSMFKEIALEPLNPLAVKAFLEMIFLPGIFADESRVCNDEIIRAFQDKILNTHMAWTAQDKKLLSQLLAEIKTNLKSQFGRLNPKGEIDWKFTRGFCIAS